MDIRKERERIGLTREDLASKLRVSAFTIYRWETKRIRPHLVFREKMERIFRAYRRKNETETKRPLHNETNK